MSKPLVQDIAKVAREIAEESFEQAKKQAGSVADAAGEQIGAKPRINPVASTTQAPAEGQIAKQMEVKDKAKTISRMAFLRQQLEQEVKRHQMAREQQLKQRREQTPQLQQQEEEKKKQQTQPPEISTKRKQGLFGIWGKRVKTAQQQAQPEMTGKRTGG